MNCIELTNAPPARGLWFAIGLRLTPVDCRAPTPETNPALSPCRVSSYLGHPSVMWSIRYSGGLVKGVAFLPLLIERRAVVKMTRNELRAFCEMENFHRFQDRLSRATEADILDVLSYLLVDDIVWHTERPPNRAAEFLRRTRPFVQRDTGPCRGP